MPRIFIFYHKLNTNQIGAVGASQGAGGVVKALIKSVGAIKTAIPIELPAHMWCTLGPDCLDTHNLTSGSVFFIEGSSDILVSPPKQPPNVTGLESIGAYYNAVPPSVPKLKGTLISFNRPETPLGGATAAPKKILTKLMTFTSVGQIGQMNLLGRAVLFFTVDFEPCCSVQSFRLKRACIRSKDRKCHHRPAMQQPQLNRRL